MSTTAADLETREPAAATPAPPVLGLAPYLQVDGARRAAEFYKRAFGAEEVAAHPEDDKGRTMHIHLYVNRGSLMLSDSYPEYGVKPEKPAAFTLHLQVEDAEAWWKRALEVGVEVVLPLQVMFWGDRYGQVRDPFGVLWSIGGPVEPRRKTN